MRKKQLLTIMLLGLATIFPIPLHAQLKGFEDITIVWKSNNDNKVYAMSQMLDSAWKPAYRYLVSIPPEASVRSRARLTKVLKKRKTYTPENTLVVCDEENLQQAEEVAPGFNVVASGAIEDVIRAYSIRKEKQGRYDYVMIPQSVK